MKPSTNQTGKTIDRGTRATRDIKLANAKPITRCCFEQRFCEVLIALIFVTVVIVYVVLTHLTKSGSELFVAPVLTTLPNQNLESHLVTTGNARIDSLEYFADEDSVLVPADVAAIVDS